MSHATTEERMVVPLEKLLSGGESGFENPREKFDAHEIKQLAESIEDDGLMYDLAVWARQTADDKTEYVVVDGERRKRAISIVVERNAKHPLAKGVPVKIVKAQTLKDARYKAIIGNVHRQDLSSYEIAQEMDRLRTMGDNQKTIAQALHKSESWVSRKLNAFEAASKPLRRAWRNGEVPDETVEEIAAIEDPEKQEELLQEFLSERGKNGRSKARRVVKKKTKKLTRASVSELQAILIVLEESPKDEPYLQGMLAMAKFAIGAVDEDGLGATWRRHKKAVEKAALEKAEADDE